ncbi:MAG TPA: protease inhibitor I9 family protein, partial [Solirubrobacteraceae bacterium]|nr:protease inhibitor I9 family protein [Solirubrobacteraceae bacterium]
MSRTARRSQRLGAILASALVAGAVGAAGLAAPATAAAPPADPGTIPGAWIVTLADGSSPDRVADDHRRDHGARVDHIYRHALNGYAARMSEEAAARVARDNRVVAVERDRVVSAVGKGNGGGGGGTQPPPQTLPTGIDRIDGELSSTVAHNGSGEVAVDVAVLDTGI